MALSLSCSLTEHGNCRKVREDSARMVVRYGINIKELERDHPLRCTCECHTKED